METSLGSVRALARTPLPRGLAVCLCGLVLAGIVLVARSAALLAPFMPHPTLVTASATVDLTLTGSVTCWWMLRRDFGWSGRALVVIFVTAVALARLFLPAGGEAPLHVMELATAPLELLLLVYLGRRVAAVRRETRAEASAGGAPPDVLDAMTTAAAAVVGRGRLAEALAYEMAVLYHALGPRRTHPAASADLSYHRKGAYGAVVFVLLLASLAEIPAAHLLVRQWSFRLAWLLTGLGLYGALWLVGDWRACRTRPIRVEGGVLRVRFGLRWSLDIPLESIRALRAPTAAEKASRGAVDLRLALPGAPWTVLELDRPIEARGPYGRRREVRSVGLGVDEPGRLEARLAAGTST